MPTTIGAPVAPPRPDRGTTSLPLPAAPPPAVPEGAPAGQAPAAEARGCLFALSQPPLMLFLTVIGALIGLGAAWDLLFV